MELFVINRHGEEKSEVTEEKEKEKLDKVLKRIERKKQQRIRQREREREKQKNAKQDNTVNKIKQKEDEQQVEVNEKQEEQSIENGAIKQKKKKKKDKHDDTTTAAVNLSHFTILGAENSVKKTKAERVLPQWLAKPTVISSNLQNLTVKVSKLKQLDKLLRQQLKANGVKYFFPVQAEVIPFLLTVHKHSDVMIPQDICVSAPTGSGKTLAFVLPVIQALKRHTRRKIRALVILPTQNLAEQVFRSFKTYTQGINIEVGLISGKNAFNVEQGQLVYWNESFGYISKIDILVCTAGRLVSHMKLTKGFDLQFLEFLIIDEADRVLESDQDDWLYHLEKHIAADNFTVQSKKILNLTSLQNKRWPQKLLFSATLTQDPEKIEKLSLFQPKLFSCVMEDAEVGQQSSSFVGKYTTPRELTEKYIVCSKELKPLVLYNFIKSENLTRTIVFVHSIETAHRLKILLQSLFKGKRKIEEMSSSLKGQDRDSFIGSFTKGEVDILICTDFLARGIDLPGVNCVISYSAPKYLKTYIHRVGRTARAGEFGLAVTVLHDKQVSAFKALLQQMKKEIEQIEVNEEELEHLSKRYKKALDQLKETVTKEEKVGINNVISKKKAVKKLKTK